jgi:hypothetical protein
MRERLESLRDLQLACLNALAAEPDKVASLSREYRATLAELDALPSETKRTAFDDLKARREARKSDAPDSPRTGRGKQAGG